MDSTELSFFPNILLEKNEVKTMELANKQVSSTAQSQRDRLRIKNPIRMDYYSELRSWVQNAILEAERRQDLSRKEHLLGLLKEL